MAPRPHGPTFSANSLAAIRPSGYLQFFNFPEMPVPGHQDQFVVTRRRGDIVDTAVVPKKHDVPVGTLRGILSQAQINSEDWDRLA